MKILIITQFYYPEPFRVNEIVEGLSKSGNDVKVLTTYPNYPQGVVYPGYKAKGVFIENINGIEITRIASRPRGKSKIGLEAVFKT